MTMGSNAKGNNLLLWGQILSFKSRPILEGLHHAGKQTESSGNPKSCPHPLPS